MELMEKMQLLQLSKKPGCANPQDAVNLGIPGMQIIRADAWKQQHWHLLTHARFPTWVHHDAAGLLTWVKVGTGMKIWEVFQPAEIWPENLPRNDFIQDGHRKLQSMLWEPETANKLYKGYLAFLEPGDLL
jgi:hypothetical protein